MRPSVAHERPGKLPPKKTTVGTMEHRHSIVSAKQYRIVDPFRIERDEVTHAKPTYISNVVRTSKYTWLNFLPLCLMQEFRRVRL